MRGRALLAEFIGTFALIFVGVLVIHNLASAESGLTGIALAHGLAIACLASATAAISGGHLNPAVTFAFLITKRIDLINAFGYWVAQILGGLVATYAAVACLAGDGTVHAANGAPALGPGITAGQGMLAEVIATFFLVFVILGTAVDARAPKMGALFIGLTVTLDIFAIGPISGAAMNPARWFGPAMVGKVLHANPNVWIFGPFLGAAVAALVYSVFLEDRRVLAPTDPIRVDQA